jgi:hypothetical protein
MADTTTQARIATPRRRTLVQKIFITGVAAFAIVVGYWMVKAFFLDDPDDRPPVVVNNGSVVFTAEDQGKGPGKWKKDTLGSKWRLSHHGKAPTYLRVQNIEGSGSTGCGAGDSHDGSSLVLTYSDGENPLTLTMEIGGTTLPPFLSKQLKIDFNAAEMDVTNHTAVIKDRSADKKLAIQSITIMKLDGTTQPCAFGANAKFKVRQLN